MPRLNLNEVEKKDFTPIPAGRYAFRITDGEIREAGPNAKNPGSQYINWELTVSEGEFEGRKVWTNTALLDNSLWRLVQLMESADRYKEEIDTEELVGHLTGAELVADVKVNPETAEYNASNDIRKFLPPGTELKGAGTSSSLLP